MVANCTLWTWAWCLAAGAGGVDGGGAVAVAEHLPGAEVTVAPAPQMQRRRRRRTDDTRPRPTRRPRNDAAGASPRDQVTLWLGGRTGLYAVTGGTPSEAGPSFLWGVVGGVGIPISRTLGLDIYGQYDDLDGVSGSVARDHLRIAADLTVDLFQIQSVTAFGVAGLGAGYFFTSLGGDGNGAFGLGPSVGLGLDIKLSGQQVPGNVGTLGFNPKTDAKAVYTIYPASDVFGPGFTFTHIVAIQLEFRLGLGG